MNLVCVCLDTFRADLVGKDEKLGFVDTPNLDEFVSNSIVFDEAFGECQPTLQMRRAFFTGKRSFPWRYNFDRRGHWHHAAGWHKIPPDQDTLAEILLSQGYMTGFISDTYHMFKPTMNYTRGFVTYDFIRGQESDNWKGGNIGELEKKLEKYVDHSRAKILYAGLIQYLLNIQNRKSEEDYFCAQVFSRSAEWIEENQSNQPFFLWIDSFDPHEPWDPPAEYLDMYPVPEYDGLPITWGGGETDDWTLAEIRHIRAQYAGTITLSDKWTGLFLEKVGDLGLLDDTMIIFLSDHGEPLGEHRIVKKVKPWPYDELSHIPFIIRLPDKMGKASKRIDGFVGFQDLAPTILSQFGVKVPMVMQGNNLLPVIQGEEEAMNFAVSGFHGRSWSIRDHGWSYYLWIGPKRAGAKTEPELYRYDAEYIPPEPADYEVEDEQPEVENLAEKEKELTPSMEKRLREFVEGLEPSPGDLMAKDFMKRQMELRTPPKA